MMKRTYTSYLIYFIASAIVIAAIIRICEIKESNALHKSFGYTNSMGNILQAYFYTTNTPYKDDPINHRKKATIATEFELKRLYNRLHWYRQYNHIDYKSNTDSAWHQINPDNTVKENYLTFWQSTRPLMQKTYNAYIKPIDIDHPVVHFRCSDSPFNKNDKYHLPKVATVQWMAEQVKNRGYNKVTILCCNQHYRMDKNSCGKYAEFYGQVFKDAGIDYSVECNSILKDFALMYYSPLLISLNQSSYSFMAGVAKDPKSWISCNMGIEREYGYVLQRDVDWILDQMEPLLHRDVTDYNDTKDVISKLRN